MSLSAVFVGLGEPTDRMQITECGDAWAWVCLDGVGLDDCSGQLQLVTGLVTPYFRLVEGYISKSIRLISLFARYFSRIRWQTCSQFPFWAANRAKGESPYHGIWKVCVDSQLQPGLSRRRFETTRWIMLLPKHSIILASQHTTKDTNW